MELHQVKALQASILQAFVDIYFNVIGWEAVIQREFTLAGPFGVLGGHLGGDVELLTGVGPHQSSQQPLTMACPVGPCRIEEVAAQFHGASQGMQ